MNYPIGIEMDVEQAVAVVIKQFLSVDDIPDATMKAKLIDNGLEQITGVNVTTWTGDESAQSGDPTREQALPPFVNITCIPVSVDKRGSQWESMLMIEIRTMRTQGNDPSARKLALLSRSVAAALDYGDFHTPANVVHQIHCLRTGGDGNVQDNHNIQNFEARVLICGNNI